MPLQFRRGTNAERLTITPAVGEPIWTTNTNRLYVGDGSTVGGVAVEIPLPSTGTFVSLTVTNIHFTGDPVGVDQTTAWTGTVAWSQIGSKPNGGLYTTSTVEFNQLSVTGSTLASTQSSILVNASGSLVYEQPHSAGYLVWGINDVGSSARIVTDAYAGSTLSAPSVSSVWTGRKARGTAAVPTAVQSGDLILRVAGTGFGTTEFATTSSGYLEVVARENFTDGARGTQINIATTNVGTNTINNSLSVASDGTTVTAPQAAVTESVLTINKTGLTSYPAPVGVDGYDIWAIREGEVARGVLDSYGTGVYSAWQGRSARGTAAAPSAIQADDIMASLRSNGYGTTGYQTTSSAYINFSAIDNFTDTQRGTRITFSATPPGQRDPDLVATMRADGVFIYSTGTTNNAMVTINGSYPNLTIPATLNDTMLHGIGKFPDQAARILLDAFGNETPNVTPTGTFSGRRSQGTVTAPSAVQAGDVLARLNGFGYGTTGYLNTSSGIINISAAENFTDSAAGGQINFLVQQPGNVGTATQTTVATMNYVDGLTVDQLNVNNLTINNTGEILTSNTTDIDIFTNQGTGNYSEVWVKHDESVQINTNGGTESWVFSKTGSLTFPDATVQNTAWTGTVANSQITSVSTSKVTGLSVVGWTNKYDDLTGKPNQGLNTTDAVQFAGITDTGPLSVTGFSSLNGGATISAATVTTNLSVGANLTAGMTSVGGLAVSTGTVTQKSLSVGGFPLNAAGTSSFSLITVASPSLIVSNYTAGLNPRVTVRGYGQNVPNGTAATNANPNITLENGFGTSASPTAVTANQNIGGFIVTGFDGLNWGSDQNQSYNFLGWFATEAMTNNGSTATYQAGSGFNVYVQPQWTRPGLNATRQRLMINTWTTSSTGPSQMNLSIGSGVDGTAPTMTMVDGTTYTGYGRANLAFPNSLMFVNGVPSQDTAPDNNSLTGTNVVTIVGNRRSGASGRRNSIVIGDNLGGISFNGQSATNSTGVGVAGAQIIAQALDNFSGGTTRGTSLTLLTVNSGTNAVPTTRALLTDRQNSYRSDSHQFTDKTGSFVGLTVTTNTNATFASGITAGGTGVTYPGDGQVQNLAWQPAYASFYDTTAAQTTGTTTGLNTVLIGTVSTASGVTLVSNGARVTNAGVYNIQQSIQFSNSGAGAQDVVVWLRQNATDLTNTAGVVTVPGTHGGGDGKIIASWTYVEDAVANDTFYLMWQPQSTNISIDTTTVGTGTPQSPGVILNVTRVR